MHKKHHISVCICTFKRPALLKRLLTKLINQKTDGLFTYSAVIVDNDRMASGRDTVTAFSCTRELAVTYCIVEEPNIALARNRAVFQGEGDLIAFIDDDEFPEVNWLFNLFRAYEASNLNGILGPVKPHFDFEPPRWVERGKFFERPTHPDGYQLAWHESRTGNVLFQRQVLDGIDVPFSPEFGAAGEDVDFFRRMNEAGFRFGWCNEAAVYESIPPSRCTRRYLLRRALLRGSNFGKLRTGKLKNAAKSLIAIPSYVIILPLLAILGQHLFLRYLIKLLDHGSRLLSFCGLRLVTERET